MRVSPVALALALVACEAPSAPDPDDGTPVLPAGLGWCVGTAAFTPAPAQGFDHLANTLLAGASSPGHSMQDVIAVAARGPVVVRGKFAYGTVSKESFVSIEKAERRLGYKPKYSNKQALIRNFEWYIAHEAKFKAASGVSHRVPWKQGALAILKRFF